MLHSNAGHEKVQDRQMTMHMIKLTTYRMRTVMLTVLMTVTSYAAAQCGYCKTFEDLLADRWVPLDSVNVDRHSKNRQFWVGGNDYALSTGNTLTDKILKEDAFAVMQGKKLYVNSRRLRYQKTRFTKGFTRAMHLGHDTLIFVNQTIGAAATNKVASTGVMFGAVGGLLAAGNNMHRRICYIISGAKDKKGNMEIEMVDDSLMEKVLKDRPALKEEYYSEPEKSFRILASHIVPILKKAGLLSPAMRKEER